MKAILFLTVCLVLPVLLCAQTKKQRKQQVPENFDRFEISPEEKPNQKDSLAFSESISGMPEVYMLPDLSTPNEDKTDPYRMPVFTVRPDYRSNMPVLVPDSSVHYYIKQAIPVKPLPKRK